VKKFQLFLNFRSASPDGREEGFAEMDVSDGLWGLMLELKDRKSI
jgi:hypothetical protein